MTIVPDGRHFDYVIVGAGSAGCVLANRLSADPDVTVCLLEAGGDDNYIWVKIPVGYLKCIGNPRTDWCYKTGSEPGLNGRSLGYPRGRILGGSSAINGMIYMRGQAADYDHWRQLGNQGWAWDDVLPFFKKSEDYFAGGDDLHGAGGEWRVEEQRLSWGILDAFQDAAAAAGIAKTDDFNRGDNEGVGYFKVNQRSGWRLSASGAFLKPVLGRPNLTIITKAETRHILFDGKRATGVVFDHDGAQRKVFADGEVILSAGAIGSPQLLQVSGVGPAELLSRYGIDPVHVSPGVGQNLQDHLQLRCVFRIEGAETLNQRANSLLGKMSIALQYALTRSGPMSMSPSQLGAFARSDPSVATADLEYHVQPLSLDKFGDPLHPFPAITASVCHLRPESRGHIEIISSDPTEYPDISPNYLSTDHDRITAARAIRLTRTIMDQEPLQQYRPEELLPGTEAKSDDELIEAAGEIGTTIFHPVGTAKMGDDPGSVVDGRLRVHGLDGLRVVDASIMPTITSGNTNSPTIMIAEKASQMIVADRRGAVQ